MQCRGSREGGAGGQKLKIGMQPQAAAQAKQDCWCSSPDEISIVYVGHSPQQCSVLWNGVGAASNCTAQWCEKCFQLTLPPQRATPRNFYSHSFSARQRKVRVCKAVCNIIHGKLKRLKGKEAFAFPTLEHHGVSVMIHHSPISFNGLSTAALVLLNYSKGRRNV